MADDSNLAWMNPADIDGPATRALVAGTKQMLRMANQLAAITAEPEMGAAMLRTAYVHYMCWTKDSLEAACAELAQLADDLPDFWSKARGEKPQRPTRQMGVDE